MISEIKLNRHDDLDLRDEILNRTPNERKRLGINKSTLWYIKKNLKKEKTVGIYDKVLSKNSLEINY